MTATATFSPCGRYRYRLGRALNFGPRVALWVMLNPSTADADSDDPTIRKCRGFTERLGFDRFEVVNLFAWRATKPKDLCLAGDPVGFDNDAHLARGIATSELVIVAWGWHPMAKLRVDDFLRIAGPNQRLNCLGRTKGGDPRHPLMLPYATELERWRI